MEENERREEEKTSPDGPKLIRAAEGSRLSNFWYHYKWHTLIGIFIVIVVTICALQMCSKESYDAQVLYAGDHTSQSPSAFYSNLENSLVYVAEDFNDDGEVNIALSNKYFALRGGGDLTPEQDSLSFTNEKDLQQMMVYGEAYLCFLSPYAYEHFRLSGQSNNDEVIMFADLTSYLPEGVTASYYTYVDEDGVTRVDTHAILLSSLDFANRPGFSELADEGTVVCLRNTAAAFKNKKSIEQFKACEALLINILSYEEY